MRIFLDDVRYPSTFDWQIIRKASTCIDIFWIYGHYITEISFDHDLGDDVDGTGYDVAKWIEKQCYLGNMKCPKWSVHSANPVGRKNIESAMKNAENYSRRTNGN